MFFNLNKNISEKEFSKNAVVLAEMDFLEMEEDEINVEEFQFDSLIDGWNSNKITISGGTYSVDADGFLTVQGNVTIAFNTSNPYVWLRMNHSFENINNLKGYLGSDHISYFGIFIAKTIETNNAPANSKIYRIQVLPLKCAVKEYVQNTRVKDPYFLLSGLDGMGYGWKLNEIKKGNKKEFIFYEKGINKTKNFSFINQSINPLFSRYASKITLKESLYKGVSTIDKLTVNINEYLNTWLKTIEVCGVSTRINLFDGALTESVLIDIKKRNLTEHYLHNFILNVKKHVELNWEEDANENYKNIEIGSDMSLGSYDLFEDVVVVKDLLHTDLESLVLKLKDGEVDFSDIEGFNLSKLHLQVCTQMLESDIDLTNQLIKRISLLDPVSGSGNPNKYKGALCLKQVEDYEIHTFFVTGTQIRLSSYFGSNNYYGLSLPPSVKLTTDSLKLNDISQFILLGIHQFEESPPLVVPDIDVQAQRFGIEINLQKIGSFTTPKWGVIKFNDLEYKNVSLILTTQTVPLDDLELQGLEYLRDSIENDPTISSVFMLLIGNIKLDDFQVASTLKYVHCYFKEISMQMHLSTFVLEEHATKDSKMEKFILSLNDTTPGEEVSYFYVPESPLNYFELDRDSKLIFLDLSKIKLRMQDSNSFRGSFAIASAYDKCQIIVKVDETLSQNDLNNHTANAITLQRYILNFNEVVLGRHLVGQSLAFSTGYYCYIEFINNIYQYYDKFKPRPLSETQDTSDYAKFISTNVYNGVKIANFIGTGGSLPKPYGYIQADQNTEGDDGQIVYPLDCTIIDGEYKSVFDTASNELLFKFDEYDTPVYLEIRIEFSGDLSEENVKDYYVLILEKDQQYWPEVSNIQLEATKQEVGVSYTASTYLDRNYIYGVFSGEGGSGAIKFNFLPKGEYTILLFKRDKYYKQTLKKLRECFYHFESVLATDKILLLSFAENPYKEMTIELNIDIDSIDNLQLDDCKVDGILVPFDNNLKTIEVKYVPNRDFVLEFVLWSTGTKKVLVYRKLELKFIDDDYYKYTESIDDHDLVLITNISTTTLYLYKTFTYFYGLSASNYMKVEVNSEWLVRDSKGSTGSRKNYLFDRETDLDIYYSPLNSAPPSPFYKNIQIDILEGTLKLCHTYGFVVSVPGGAREDYWSIDFHASKPPSKKSEATYEEFRIYSSLFFKVFIMYLQYAYILTNQKKDYSNTLKYRWTFT